MPPLTLKPTDVVLVRHGETLWSKSGQHTGSTDLPLTPEGEAAARELSPVLETFRFARVISSPLQRAWRTAELAGFGGRMVADPDLVEWNYGLYEGLTSAEIVAQTPDWLIFRDGAPQGESPAAVGERVDRVVAGLRGGPGPVLVFAHGHVLRVLTARWLGHPPSAGSHFLLDTATLSVLSDYRGLPALACWNARPCP
jgi:broad specificity phosphatase PhoE